MTIGCSSRDVRARLTDDYGASGYANLRSSGTLELGKIRGEAKMAFAQKMLDYMRDSYEIDSEDTPYRFDTPEAARAAGFDPTQDICWSVHGHFDHDLKPSSHGDYWEWAGW